MARIVIFGNQKGGSGKSLCTILCANALSTAPFNKRVLVLDCDPQFSLMDARRYDQSNFTDVLPYEIHSSNFKTFASKANEYNQQYDYIFLDVAGKLDTTTNGQQENFLMYADFLFIPFVAGLFNFDSSQRYLKFIFEIERQRRDSSRPLNLICFINRFRERSRTNRFLLQDIEELQKVRPIQLMTNKLGDYTNFSDTNTLTSLYNENSSDPASLNFTVWLKEILRITT